MGSHQDDKDREAAFAHTQSFVGHCRTPPLPSLVGEGVTLLPNQGEENTPPSPWGRGAGG